MLNTALKLRERLQKAAPCPLDPAGEIYNELGTLY